MRMKYHLMDLLGSLRGSSDFWILLLDLESKQNNIYWINLSGLSCNKHSQQDRFPDYTSFIHLNSIFLILRLFKISTIYGVSFFSSSPDRFFKFIFNDLPLALQGDITFLDSHWDLFIDFHDFGSLFWFFALHIMSTFMLSTLLIFYDSHVLYVLQVDVHFMNEWMGQISIDIIDSNMIQIVKQCPSR
jgi:hypothetical protein